jgi:hypothetical protein
MKNTKLKCYRHGEICLLPIKKLPKGLKESKDKVLIQGSHGNSHSVDNGKIYFSKESEFVFGYLVAKNTNLLHEEHGKGNGAIKKAKLPDGIYQLIKQQEFTPSGLVPIVD